VLPLPLVALARRARCLALLGIPGEVPARECAGSRSEAETGLQNASSDRRERQLSRGHSSRENEPGAGDSPLKRRDRRTQRGEGLNLS